MLLASSASGGGREVLIGTVSVLERNMDHEGVVGLATLKTPGLPEETDIVEVFVLTSSDCPELEGYLWVDGEAPHGLDQLRAALLSGDKGQIVPSSMDGMEGGGYQVSWNLGGLAGKRLSRQDTPFVFGFELSGCSKALLMESVDRLSLEVRVVTSSER